MVTFLIHDYSGLLEIGGLPCNMKSDDSVFWIDVFVQLVHTSYGFIFQSSS